MMESLQWSCVLCYWIVFAPIVSTSVRSSEPIDARTLLWPVGNTHKIQVIVGFGIPSPELLDASVTLGVVLKFSYDVPSNVSQLNLETRQKRDITPKSLMSRWNIYSLLELVGTRLGFDGKACLLRNICDAASSPLHHNGVLGELLHVVLTPSSTAEDVASFSAREYNSAERNGVMGVNCQQCYPECTAGILDLVTKLY